jgi:hypothetical protein
MLRVRVLLLLLLCARAGFAPNILNVCRTIVVEMLRRLTDAMTKAEFIKLPAQQIRGLLMHDWLLLAATAILASTTPSNSMERIPGRVHETPTDVMPSNNLSAAAVLAARYLAQLTG